MEHSASNLEKESSAIWASSNGNCSEAPCGAAKQDPAEEGAGGTSLIGEERQPAVEKTSENLEGLTEKVGTLGIQITKKNRYGAARKQARRTRLRRLAVVNRSTLERIDRGCSRSTVHLGLCMENDRLLSS
jgi:hypothetical protein